MHHSPSSGQVVPRKSRPDTSARRQLALFQTKGTSAFCFMAASAARHLATPRTTARVTVCMPLTVRPRQSL